jgi:hypothetical protein
VSQEEPYSVCTKPQNSFMFYNQVAQTHYPWVAYFSQRSLAYYKNVMPIFKYVIFLNMPYQMLFLLHRTCKLYSDCKCT